MIGGDYVFHNGVSEGTIMKYEFVWQEYDSSWIQFYLYIDYAGAGTDFIWSANWFGVLGTRWGIPLFYPTILIMLCDPEGGVSGWNGVLFICRVPLLS